MNRIIKSVMTGSAILTIMGMAAFPAFASVPVGAAIFSNGQAMDLNYLNLKADQKVVQQDVVGSKNVWIKSYSGTLVNNVDPTKTVDVSTIPGVIYMDKDGKITYYNPGDGDAVTVGSVTASNGTITATLSTTPTITPVVADFVVTQQIDGAAATTVTPTVAMNGAVATLTVAPVVATTADQSVVYSVAFKGEAAQTAPAVIVTPSTDGGTIVGTGFTAKTVGDVVGNTIVNVTVTASNVTGVKVKGVAATFIPDMNMWRAVLDGTVTVSATDIALTTTTGPVNAIDTTETKAVIGFVHDVAVYVHLLSGVTPSSVTSVTLADGTAIPYDTTKGYYYFDKIYAGTDSLPTSMTVVLTTAGGSQTVTVPVTE